MSTPSTTPYDAKLITNTLAGIGQNIERYLGIAPAIPEKTTMNEVLGIFAKKLPPATAIPVAKYLIIGNRGHRLEADDDIPTFLPIGHEPVDQGPFGKVPFILRPVDNDLSDLERAKYCLRRKEEHAGKQYWAYYGRRMDHRAVKVGYFITRVRNGVKSTTTYKFSDKNIFPQPPAVPYYPYETDNHVTTPDGDYVHAGATIRITFDLQDIEEALNVSKVLHGTPNKAVMSEFAICTGVDSNETGESMVGSPFTYKEALVVMPDLWMTTYENVALQNSEVAFDITVTQGAPMLLASMAP